MSSANQPRSLEAGANRFGVAGPNSTDGARVGIYAQVAGHRFLIYDDDIA